MSEFVCEELVYFDKTQVAGVCYHGVPLRGENTFVLRISCEFVRLLVNKLL